MIRKTNRGSVMPFATRTAVGKKLATKGKSSNALFSKGNITFFSQMAKKMEDKDWLKEQNTLVEILKEKVGKKSENSKYKFIPKLLTEKQVKESLSGQKDKIAKALKGESFTVDDIISGKRMDVMYKLVKTVWSKINDGDLKGLLVKPDPEVEDDTPLFRVYVKTKMICGFPMVNDFSEDLNLTLALFK